MKKLILSLILIFCSVHISWAGTYYVDDNGAATWANCEDAAGVPGPKSGTAACSLTTANTYADAGDLVYLRAGTYSTGIAPANSGSSGAGNRITFRKYTGETPVISNGEDQAIYLSGKSYITIDGINLYNVGTFYLIINGSHYNEICNSTMNIATGYDYSSGFIGNGSTHNWIHDNVITKYGKTGVCSGLGGTIRVGATDTYANDASFYNTIEDNVVSYGGHDNIDIESKYNVCRNNISHNEEAYYSCVGLGCSRCPSSGFVGERNIIIANVFTDYNLIEGNRAGHAGTPPSSNGAMGIENAGSHMIIRYNYMFNNGAAGYLHKDFGGALYADYAAVYNNTIYRNGYGDALLEDYWRWGVAVDCNTGTGHPYGVRIKNNIVYGNYGEYDTMGTCGTGQITYSNNLNTNPTFTNPDYSDPTSLTLPDLSFGSSSAAKDGGTYLTTVSSVTDSDTIVVADALYFQDGTWGSSLSDIQADWICLTSGTTVDYNKCVQISSITYSSNTINTASAHGASAGWYVWLYKKSDGTRVLYGTRPDYGAYEYGIGTTPPVVTITTPSSDPYEIRYNSPLAIAGTATETPTQCKWRIGSAPDDSNGTALTGTTAWSGTAESFVPGLNTLYVGCTNGTWGSDSTVINLVPSHKTGIRIFMEGNFIWWGFEGREGIEWREINLN